MKKIFVSLLIASILSIMLSACGGGYGGGGAYFRSDYGYGPWRGYPGYIDNRPIIIPPDGGGGDLEAVPLPEPPIDMPEPEAMPMDMEPMDVDLGMPDIDIDL